MIRIISILCLFIAGTALNAGCGPKETTAQQDPLRSSRGVPRSASQAAGTGDREVVRGDTPVTDRIRTHVYTGILPHGFVPYDNMTLPLISPDGRFLVTQTGEAPTWDTILARQGAQPPRTTRLEIYRIGMQMGETPQLAHVLDEPALLGRACDHEGFLIESPRDDGSRWIGKASWRTGEITWHVADDAVNAFATFGAHGRLAWSRRAQNDRDFALVVRQGPMQWTLTSNQGSWLMPSFSGIGDGLFVVSLASGFLDLVHANGRSEVDFRQTMRRLPIKQEAGLWAAYQTLCAHPVVIDGRVSEFTQLAFFHIPHSRAAIWRPDSGEVLNLRERTFTALPIEGNCALAGSDRALLMQNLGDFRDRKELVKGTIVARPTALRENWPYLIMEAGNGRVAITALNLLSIEDLAQAE